MGIDWADASALNPSPSAMHIDQHLRQVGAVYVKLIHSTRQADISQMVYQFQSTLPALLKQSE